MKALVTGFEPFGGDTVNPSVEAARSLPRKVGRFSVLSKVLPVACGRAGRMLEAMIRAERPDCVICLGLAGARRDVAIETAARNLKDARIPDNDGNQPRSEPIDPRGPSLLPPSLPVTDAVGRLRALQIPCSPSPSARAYLCNYVLYRLMRHAARDDLALRAGFIHLPYSSELLPAHPGAPFLPLEKLVRGIRAVLGLLSR